MAMFPGVILFISWCSVSLDRNLIKYLVIHTEEAEKIPYSLDSQNVLYVSTGKEKQPFCGIYSQREHRPLYPILGSVFAKLVLNAQWTWVAKRQKMKRPGLVM